MTLALESQILSRCSTPSARSLAQIGVQIPVSPVVEEQVEWYLNVRAKRTLFTQELSAESDISRRRLDRSVHLRRSA